MNGTRADYGCGCGSFVYGTVDRYCNMSRSNTNLLSKHDYAYSIIKRSIEEHKEQSENHPVVKDADEKRSPLLFIIPQYLFDVKKG